ncbi:hypothetical protein [Cupriavidus pauculus]|uniref:5-formyltetrahydrofolate cyclo-ligase n=1 Tax=Cupriavidus pauculus TaxID=82633 RepID=A0A2N5CAN6_9BURK|nr:hypothetical protein [Cupriavidus pauculus]PLP99292.1 hypothetical protein CYJ10_18590 [Cupriavidus pauculus]
MLVLSMLPLFGASGCVTHKLVSDATSLERKGKYEEVIDQVMMTADGTKLVVIAPKHHCIFDVKPQFAELLHSPLHQKLTAHLSTFRVEPGGVVSGAIGLTLSDLDDAEYASARAFGLYGSRTNMRGSYDLRGERYSAGGFRMPGSMKPLNRSYEVTVEECSRRAKPAMVLLTPLTEAVDGVLVLAAIPLVPILILSRAGVPIIL